MCHAFLSDNNLQRACVAEGGNFDWLFKETVTLEIWGLPSTPISALYPHRCHAGWWESWTSGAYDETLQRGFSGMVLSGVVV